MKSINTALDVIDIEKEQFYVQSRPLIQYGPLSLEQLKELYIYDVIDDNTFIALSREENEYKNNPSTSENSFKIIPNEQPLWNPLRSVNVVHVELTDALSAYTKTPKITLLHQLDVCNQA